MSNEKSLLHKIYWNAWENAPEIGEAANEFARQAIASHIRETEVKPLEARIEWAARIIHEGSKLMTSDQLAKWKTLQKDDLPPLAAYQSTKEEK